MSPDLEFRWLQPAASHDPVSSPPVLQWRVVVVERAGPHLEERTATNWQTVPKVYATVSDYQQARREQA